MSSGKRELITNEIYHIYTRSIAEFRIFNSPYDFQRIQEMIKYYQQKNPPYNFSKINPLTIKNTKPQTCHFILDKEKIVQIIAYVIMPTHIHLILKQLQDRGISIFMQNVLNSYTRYFNIKHNRKGPLWEGRFKAVLVKTEEQLLHLTRYIHLNPVTAYLVNNPLDWEASSYKEYLFLTNINKRICKYEDILKINPENYKNFVEDFISYQRDLAKISDLVGRFR